MGGGIEAAVRAALDDKAVIDELPKSDEDVMELAATITDHVCASVRAFPKASTAPFDLPWAHEGNHGPRPNGQHGRTTGSAAVRWIGTSPEVLEPSAGQVAGSVWLRMPSGVVSTAYQVAASSRRRPQAMAMWRSTRSPGCRPGSRYTNPC
jgi:hypothetical protein